VLFKVYLKEEIIKINILLKEWFKIHFPKRKLIVLFEFVSHFKPRGVCIQKLWDAKSNKTIDFLYEKFISKHFFQR